MESANITTHWHERRVKARCQLRQSHNQTPRTVDDLGQERVGIEVVSTSESGSLARRN